MKCESTSLNIEISPPAGISQRAISVSQAFKSRSSLFVLDNKNYFPHISLYMTEFPLENIKEISKNLKQLASETKPFIIESTGYKQDNDGYIYVSYQISLKIKKLQTDIVKLLNPLRRGLIRKNDKLRIRLGKYSKAQQKNVQLYGYRGVGNEFNPHLTFAKLETFDKTALSLIPKYDFSFEASKIGLFYLGDYGTCHKPIKIFNLSKK
ncbi:MAG: 2'-5' RNA ligase family protein [Patescibacteria group bacterium]